MLMASMAVLVLSMGVLFQRSARRASVLAPVPSKHGRGFRSLALIPALGAVLTFTVVPSFAWAKTSGETAASVSETARSITPGTQSQEPAATSKDYASREASAKELEQFAGGDTVVIAGGSLLVIVLVVVLILVLI